MSFSRVEEDKNFFIKNASFFAGASAVGAVSLFALGLFAFLEQEGFSFSLLKGIGTIGAVGIGSSLGASILLTGAFLFFVTQKFKNKSPECPKPLLPSVKPSVNYGLIKRAPNFCYADSVLAALFLGFSELDAFMKEPKQITEEQKKFLEHLWNEIIVPIRNGKDASSETLKACQKLVWEAGWKEKSQSETMTSEADAFMFTRFFMQMLHYPELAYKVQSLKEEEYVLTVPMILPPDTKTFSSQLTEILKAYFALRIDEMDSEFKNEPVFGKKIDIPELVALAIDRYDLSDHGKRITHPLHFREEIVLREVFPEKLITDSGYSIKDRLSLRAIVNHHENHYWSFFVRYKDTNMWLKYNDLRSEMKFLSFDEVKKNAATVGRIFYFQFMQS